MKIREGRPPDGSTRRAVGLGVQQARRQWGRVPGDRGSDECDGERRRSPAAESDDEQRDRQCRVAKSRDVLAQPRRHEIRDRDRDGVRGQEVPHDACALHPPSGNEAERTEADRHRCFGDGKRIAACAGEQPQEHELGCAGGSKGERGDSNVPRRAPARQGNAGEHDHQDHERERARRQREQGQHGEAPAVARLQGPQRQQCKRESERERKPCRDQEPGPDDRKAAARPTGA